MNNYLILIAAMFLNSACVPAIMGASATTGVVIAQERTVGDALDDATITAKIKSEFLQHNLDHLFATVHVKTSEGRVMLTGHTHDPEIKVKAVRIAWNQKGVKEVINEIKLAEDSNKLAIKEYGVDTWITAQIKAKMLLNKEIRSINYNVETIRGVVYLLGIAQHQSELDQVVSIAESIQHVKKVVNYVRSKDDHHRDKK